MKLIVGVNAQLVLLEPATHRPQTSWPGHGQIVWRDTEPRSNSCDAREVVVPSGTYSLVRIRNPFRAAAEPWLVLAGSRTGAAESHWRKLLARTPGVRIEAEEEAETSLPPGGTVAERVKAA